MPFKINPTTGQLDYYEAAGSGGGGGGANLTFVPGVSNGVVVSDSGTDATILLADATNAGLMTAAEKTKLTGIAVGAEVNVNPDWNATSGDAQILNKPAIPAAQVNVDWNATSGIEQILNKPSSLPTANVKHSVKYAEALTKGQAVYVSGADGTNMLVSKADNSAEATSSKTLGLVTASGAANYQGEVITEGLLAGLNTSSATIGDAVWLGTAGNLIFWHYGLTTKPVAPAHLVFIGVVTRVNASNGEIFVKPQNGFEIDELHDVSIIGRANNTLLGYNSTTGLHEFKTVAGWLGFTPAATAGSDLFELKPNYVYRGITINNNSTTVVSEGGVVMSSSASNLAQSVASTNFATKQIRLRYYAASVTGGRYSGTRGSALLWYIQGGFHYVCDFNISDTAYAAGCQQFYGMAGQTADLSYGTSTPILVSTLTNIIGVGNENGDANLQVFHNDATGTASKIDLGVDFPANRTSGAISTTFYSVQLYNAPSSTDVHYKVTNNETGAVATGVVSTNLPLSSQGLNFFASRSMAATSVTGTGQFDLSKLGVYSIL
jgi:hypothetical protein